MHPTRAAHERWIPTNRVRARGLTGLSVALALSLLGADAAHANSLTTAVSTGARATVPMTVSASGSADPTATLRVYVQQPGGAGCAGGGSGAENAAAQRLRAGSTEVIAQQPLGPFSYSATYTPPVAGSYSLCAYLFGSSPGTGASQSSTSFNVGAAPPPPATPAPAVPGTSGTPQAKKRCVVPTLKGRTYGGARTLIRRAGCSVGTVFRPSLRTSRAARARGRVLRVVSQSPRPRSVRKAGARVTLRLALVRRSRR